MAIEKREDQAVYKKKLMALKKSAQKSVLKIIFMA